VPVFCGTALKNKGVRRLLNGVIAYLPSPLDIPAIKGVNPDTREEELRKTQDSEPFSALAFKVMVDPYVGRLVYVRVYSGTLKTGTYAYNSTKEIKERVAKILKMHANKQEIVEEVHAGDIAAIAGLKNTTTGDTLALKEKPIILEKIHFPEPVISMAIEPTHKFEQDKMIMSLKKLEEEDPTFKVRYVSETGETVVQGMGELHLDIMIDRMKREFKVESNMGKPQVAYKETITKEISSVGKFIQQSGGRGQYGHVVIRILPGTQGSGVTFTSKIKSGVIPKEYIPSCKQGIFEGAMTGVLLGYPTTDIDVYLEDGSYHEVDSSEIAFKMAAEIALSDGLRRAGAILLEPIMEVEVVVPDEYLGEVLSDLNSRRCRIEALEQRGNAKVARGNVPLSEMFGYATVIRTLTQGRGTFSMEPTSYAKVPNDIVQKLLLTNSKKNI